MTIISAVCWGSWANTFKITRGYRFELFYWDYALGICLIALVLAFTMGSLHPDGLDFRSNLHSADAANFYYAIAAGVVFNVANVLLVAGIDMAGMAIAFPLRDRHRTRRGRDPELPAESEGQSSAAGHCRGVRHHRRDPRRACVQEHLNAEQGSSRRPASSRASRKSIVVCVISGLLMGLFAPIVSHALNTGHA